MLFPRMPVYLSNSILKSGLLHRRRYTRPLFAGARRLTTRCSYVHGGDVGPPGGCRRVPLRVPLVNV